MVFEEEIFDFGEVEEGVVVKYIYYFINMGKMFLIISNVRFICGCIVFSWLEELIVFGEKGKIDVEFNIKGKIEN